MNVSMGLNRMNRRIIRMYYYDIFAKKLTKLLPIIEKKEITLWQRGGIIIKKNLVFFFTLSYQGLGNRHI